MLPKLQETDLLSHQPDAEGVDVLAEGFGIETLPRGMGVYCFYEPTTGEVLYIGSACGRDTHGRRDCGLFLRMLLYRRPRQPHDLKVHNAVKERGLLLRVWLTDNEADARKYEADAIKRLSPPLNVLGCVRETPEESRQRVNAHVRRTRARRIEKMLPYDPDLVRTCKSCGYPKKCREFRRCNGKRLHTHPVCKLCEAEARRVVREPRTSVGRPFPGPSARIPSEHG